MFKNDFYNNALYPTKGINSVGWRISLHGANGFFVFGRLCYFIGFLSYLFPSLFLMRVFQRGGNQQSNLLSASAGSDLRMSPLRPNPYLSAEVKMRKSKFRGFFQLFSRPN